MEKKQFNINYEFIPKNDIYGLYLTNNYRKTKFYEFPIIGDFSDEYPDYLVLFTEKGNFKLSNVGVCWFCDDTFFDKIDGLYNSIIYKNEKMLLKYKKMFEGVKYFIQPDFSLYGDFDNNLVVSNMRKALICFLWLKLELNVIVYPLMTYSDEKSLEWCFDHLKKGSNIAISLKGIMDNKNKELFYIALRKMIDIVSPKSIIVYTVAKRTSTLKMLSYAFEKGINVIIPENTLLLRNNAKQRKKQ